MVPHSLGWFQWVCDTLTVLPGFEERSWVRVEGAVYEGDLLNYAALQGSVEILRWLMEEKGWELNWKTGWWVGWGGSVQVLEYLEFITTKGLNGHDKTKRAYTNTRVRNSATS